LTEHLPEQAVAIVASDADPVGLPDELIDELLAGARTPEEIAGPDGLLQRLTKRLVERAMAAELSEHLGYELGQAPPGGTGNARNGTTPKTIHTGHGSVRIEQPRDRAGSFEPPAPVLDQPAHVHERVLAPADMRQPPRHLPDERNQPLLTPRSPAARLRQHLPPFPSRRT
jgi:hypothetical protein